MSSYYWLRQELNEITNELTRLQSVKLLYGLGKLSMSSRERSEWGEAERIFGPMIDPFANIRARFATWNTNADLYVEQFKKNAIVKGFNKEKEKVQRMLDKKKPDLQLLLTKIGQLAVHLDNINSISYTLTQQEKPKPRVKEVTIKPYDILKGLEIRLRACIQNELVKVDKNWWNSRMPSDVKQRAEERRSKNEKIWPWHEQRDLHPIHYVDFTDYAKIIVRKDNWEQVFKPIFQDAEITSAKLRELEPIRNDIAHSRELTNKQKDRLRILSEDLLACLPNG